MPRPPAGSRQTTSKAPRRRGAARPDHAAPNRAASATPQPPGILPYLTVAIGASAGGLHAFTTFLDNLPPDTGMAFVLIQHLDPIHKSLLVSLLAPHTAMPVVEAADGMPLAPNTVFVIPPDATMTIEARPPGGLQSRRRRGSIAGRSTASSPPSPRTRSTTPSASSSPARAATARAACARSSSMAASSSPRPRTMGRR